MCVYRCSCRQYCKDAGLNVYPLTVVLISSPAVVSLLLMGVAAASIAASVFMLNHHYEDLLTRPHKWQQTLAFVKLAPIICKHDLHVDELNNYRRLSHKQGKSAKSAASSSMMGQANGCTDARLVALRNTYKRLFADVREHLQDISSAVRRHRVHHLVRHEWRMLAKVVDRLMLAVFAFVLTVILVGFLIIV